MPVKVKAGSWCGVCASHNLRSTLAEYQQLAAERGGRCLSTGYVNNNTHLLWECAKGHQWKAVPSSVKSGSWCRLCATERLRVSLAEVQHAAQKLSGHCLSTEYVNGTTALLFECAAGHRFEAAPAAVRQGHWCPRCAHNHRRLTIGQMRELAASRGGECLSERYIDQRTHVRWRCAKGHEWESSPNAMRDHWCPRCSVERRSLGIDQMHKLAADRGGRCLSLAYAGAHQPLEWQCAQGHQWSAAPTNMRKGAWCPRCSGRRITLADMQALADSRGGACLSDTYVSSTHKLQWQCHRGHTWWTAPATVRNGHWCPECAIVERCRTRKARRRYEAVALPEWDSGSKHRSPDDAEKLGGLSGGAARRERVQS